MQGLAPIDAWALLAILAKAVGYGAALLAIGGPLFLSIFRSAPAPVLRAGRQMVVWACLIGLVILALRFGIRAGRLGGEGLASMVDPILLGVVWDSPLSALALLRASGYLLVLVSVLIQPLLLLGLVGAALIALSGTQIGHVSAVAGPFPNILIVHLVMAGFWAAALWPLHQAVRTEKGADLLRAFGWIAVGVVALLVLAGLALSWVLVGGVLAGVGTAYGTVLVLKLLGVAGLVALAARNKLKLVPALERGAAGAAQSLQSAIRWEMAVIALILVITATVTTVTTPPVNM